MAEKPDPKPIVEDAVPARTDQARADLALGLVSIGLGILSWTLLAARFAPPLALAGFVLASIPLASGRTPALALIGAAINGLALAGLFLPLFPPR